MKFDVFCGDKALLVRAHSFGSYLERLGAVLEPISKILFEVTSDWNSWLNSGIWRLKVYFGFLPNGTSRWTNRVKLRQSKCRAVVLLHLWQNTWDLLSQSGLKLQISCYSDALGFHQIILLLKSAERDSDDLILFFCLQRWMVVVFSFLFYITVELLPILNFSLQLQNLVLAVRVLAPQFNNLLLQLLYLQFFELVWTVTLVHLVDYARQLRFFVLHVEIVRLKVLKLVFFQHAVEVRVKGTDRLVEHIRCHCNVNHVQLSFDWKCNILNRFFKNMGNNVWQTSFLLGTQRAKGRLWCIQFTIWLQLFEIKSECRSPLEIFGY